VNFAEYNQAIKLGNISGQAGRSFVRRAARRGCKGAQSRLEEGFDGKNGKDKDEDKDKDKDKDKVYTSPPIGGRSAPAGARGGGERFFCQERRRG
jgi:hypothetical protein